MSERGYAIFGHPVAAPAAAPGLHVVATPIGNLADITLRALSTLAAVDVVAAEDTRHTGRLLQHYGIRAELVRYDDHAAPAARPRLLGRLEEGAAVALVSDAGTPLVSDPGFRLVREARERGVPVHAVPGPSAPVAALSVAGVPSDAFLFAGFLPPRSAARRTRIEALAAVPATLVLFEAAQRLSATLADLAAALGAEREAAVARELTKRFETVERGSLATLAERYAGAPPKGEIVVLVAPADAPAPLGDDEVDALLRRALERLPASAAAADVARATGRDRKSLYARLLALREGSGEG